MAIAFLFLTKLYHFMTGTNSDKNLRIGDIFTPIKWAKFAIDKFDLFDKWLNGASIFDPTMGKGSLLKALMETGLQKGHDLEKLPVKSLFGNELNSDHHKSALKTFNDLYQTNMSQNFSNCDLLTLQERPFDIIFGNPPWLNFVDLPNDYKENIKNYFYVYDLISNSQKLLLGGSRIELAALMIQISVKNFLIPSGIAVFFFPLSLLLNDGANEAFRTYKINEIKFQIESIYDFGDARIFQGIDTRYGLMKLKRDRQNNFPLPYFIYKKGHWENNLARPMFNDTDPLSILTEKQTSDFKKSFSPVSLTKDCMPRQGINTCGANDIFFFDDIKFRGNDICICKNKTYANIELPKSFLYPLITSKNFKYDHHKPDKWVLLPYCNSGKLLEINAIREIPLLYEYLSKNKTRLTNRKGTMIKSFIQRGYWYALLGVGIYSFFPYKIVWEAYGKSNFNPVIFTGNWQANQSLQAFIPCKNKEDAETTLKALKQKCILDYLLSLRMQGTMNWAQPGKIKKLIQYKDDLFQSV